MTLTLEVSEKEAERIEEARRHGVDVDALLRRFFSKLPSRPAPAPIYETASDEEWEAYMDELARLDDVIVPSLPHEAFDRENIYEDRL